MKKLFFLAILTMAVIATSCKKDDDKPFDGKLVTKVTCDYQSQEWNYEYDKQGRVTRVFLTDVYDGTNALVNYADKMEQTFYFTDHNGQNAEEDELYSFTMNNQGYVASKNRDDGVVTCSYQYNDNGQLTAYRRDIDSPYETYTVDCQYTWQNGNCTSLRYNVEGGFSYSVSYEYYTDKPNLSNIWMPGEDVFTLADGIINTRGYQFGKSSTQLLKSITLADDEHTGNTYTYAYTLDSEGYVTQIAETISSSPGVNNYMIYYNK